ncbi:hypothetical protein CHH47_24985 [Priestia megaterium]|nr:hypothetical protein CHH47_24985 [Priestia megaterium]
MKISLKFQKNNSIFWNKNEWKNLDLSLVKVCSRIRLNLLVSTLLSVLVYLKKECETRKKLERIKRSRSPII